MSNKLMNFLNVGSETFEVADAVARLGIGSPLVAATVSAMTDTSKIYVYTGSETGYTAGNWYYYNGSVWTSGGVYNSGAVNVDTTLQVSGAAADSKTVGDKFDEVEADIAEIPVVVANPDGAVVSNLNRVKIGDDIYALYGTQICYGFHIDGSNSDGEKTSNKITYLEDAVGMTPAYMDYVNDRFVYGSWQNAFFMPRPCMLKNDGTVDYYLDENDYSKKADGTASDIANDNYAGNAMMEWGRDGQRIWYKIVPDSGDSTSASVYIANMKLDDDFHAWSFYDANNNLKDHFYTPIYNGSIVNDGTNDVLRSLSGKTYTDYCKNKTAAVEIQMAERNNVGNDKGWYTEVFADVILIQMLCYLISKSTDVQTAFGNGNMGSGSTEDKMLDTGTMNDKGLFWGASDGVHGVKVFGMENFWANQYRRYAGHYLVDYVNKYKLTRNTADGSEATDYSTADATGYLTGGTSPSENGYYSQIQYDSTGAIYVNSVTGGGSNKYYYDYYYQSSGIRYALRGGSCNGGVKCGFFVGLNNGAANAGWGIGAALSYK